MRFLNTLITLLTLSLLLMRPLSAQTIDKILAIVNDKAITQSDVNRVLATIEAEYRSVYTKPEELAQRLELARKNIINQMVEEKLILCAAREYEIKADEDRIEVRIEGLKQGFSSDQEFEMALEAGGLSLNNLRDRFRNQEIMKKAVDYFVRARLKVDPIEIKQFYQAHQKELVRPERVRLKSILIRVDESGGEHEALQRAKLIYERLRKGDNFEDLARAYSQGVDREAGGSLGVIEKGQLIEEIDQVIFRLRPDEFTEVIKTEQGYRIFKVEEKMPVSPLSFSKSQDQIRQILYEEKFSEIFKEWIEELKQDAYIQIKKEAPGE